MYDELGLVVNCLDYSKISVNFRLLRHQQTRLKSDLQFIKCQQAVRLQPIQPTNEDKFILLVCGIRPVKDPITAIKDVTQTVHLTKAS